MINHPDFFNQANGQKGFACSLRKIVKTASLSLFLFVFLSNTGVLNVCAQDTEPTPPAEETPAAEEEKPAAAPEPKSTPLGGTVEGSDKIQIEPKIQSYRSVKDITRDIADDIYQFKPDAKRFVLYGADDYKTWQHYRLNKNRLETQMNTLICDYEIWISLAKTAFETNPRGETRRKIFADIPNGDSCAPYRDVIGASPEIREFRRIITEDDDERLGLGLMREEIEELSEQIRANNTELQNLITRQKNAGRISLKDKRRKNDLLERKLLLDQQFRDRQMELARREKDNESDTDFIGALKNNDSTKINWTGVLGAAAGAISPVTSLVGTAIDLISYFRSDISFSGATVSNKDKVARFNIANALQTRYCLGDTKKLPLVSKGQKFDKKDERRIAERQAGIKLITAACTVDVYDPDLYTPDIVYSGRTSNGVDADGKSLPLGIEWMADLTDLRERSRVAIAAYDFQTTRKKNLETKIAALDTAIAADDTAIKGYTDTLITLIEKGKVDKPVKAKKNQEKGMVETAFDNIKEIIDRANETRSKRIEQRTKVTKRTRRDKNSRSSFLRCG